MTQLMSRSSSCRSMASKATNAFMMRNNISTITIGSRNIFSLSQTTAVDSHTGNICCHDGARCGGGGGCHHHRQMWLCRRTMSSNSSNSTVESDWVRTAIQKMILEQQQQQQQETVGSGSETTTTTSPPFINTTATSMNSASSLSGTTNAVAAFETTDLEKTLQSLQNRLTEAELCIQDCYECVNENQTCVVGGDALQKEIDAADQSIDVAVAHFVDLLDAKQQHSQQVSLSSSSSSSSNLNSTSASTTTTTDRSNHTGNAAATIIPTEDLVKRIKHLRSEISKLKLVQQQSIMTTTSSN